MIDEETEKLRRLLAKYRADYRVITDMISDLHDDRIRIGREIMWIEQLLEREPV